jgi:hypothetical protein
MSRSSRGAPDLGAVTVHLDFECAVAGPADTARLSATFLAADAEIERWRRSS